MPPSIPPKPSPEAVEQAGGSAPRPWRTEGLPADPSGPAGKPELKWGKFLLRGLFIYGAVFMVLTIQDRMSGPQAISYTEFDKEVEAGNIAEVFARGHTIQGALRTEKAIPEPKPNPNVAGATYKRFSTERPASC